MLLQFTIYKQVFYSYLHFSDIVLQFVSLKILSFTFFLYSFLQLYYLTKSHNLSSDKSGTMHIFTKKKYTNSYLTYLIFSYIFLQFVTQGLLDKAPQFVRRQVTDNACFYNRVPAPHKTTSYTM